MSVRWRNWGRSAEAQFDRIAVPGNEAELQQLIREAVVSGQRIRPVGAGHSFTPIAVTDGISLRLNGFTGLRSVAGDLVTLGAGTRLRDIPALLRPYRLAMENLGDIDAQTLAGAISTGTHGTGATFTGLAGQVRGLRLVLADGTAVTCSDTERPDLFAAARLGLGAFGVLTEVALRCVPEFVLAADEHPEPLDAVLEGFAERSAAADHVEFYWFPHTPTALVKSNRRLPSDTELEPVPRIRGFVDDELLSNGLFGATCAAGAAVPALIRPVNRLAARLVSDRRYADRSQVVFTSPRRVRFREMEYAIARDDLPDALREVRTLIDRRDWRISFPLEIRVAAADDIWLSTAFGRDTAYLAVHRYHREPFAEYFLAVEQILASAGGRPHWGKLHSLGAVELAARYPRFADAVAVRDQVDPTGVFRNPYLDRVLGRPPPR